MLLPRATDCWLVSRPVALLALLVADGAFRGPSFAVGFGRTGLGARCVVGGVAARGFGFRIGKSETAGWIGVAVLVARAGLMAFARATAVRTC